MDVTEDQLRKAEEIYLEQARAHFPPSVQFKEANASVITDKCGDEWIRIEFLYDAPEPVLDAKLMNSLHRRTDGPMLAAGITGLTMVGYVNTNDPARLGFERPPRHQMATNNTTQAAAGYRLPGTPPGDPDEVTAASWEDAEAKIRDLEERNRELEDENRHLRQQLDANNREPSS